MLSETQLEERFADEEDEQYSKVSFNINGTPIEFKQRCIVSDEATTKNVLAALKTPYPALGKVDHPTDLPLAIVGSGPSLKDNWQMLEGWPGEIFCLNSAHDFLIDRNILPTAAVAIEGGEAICNYFKNPHPEVKYLLSTACHPKLFKQLKKQNIILFHLALKATVKAFQEWIDPPGKPLLTHERENRQRFIAESTMVAGASTVLTRALCLAAMIGHRDFHFFGCDSSFFAQTEQGTKVTDGTQQGDYPKEIILDLKIKDKIYKTSPQLLQQVFALKQMMESDLSKQMGLKFSCYGDSLMQESM